MTCYVQNTSNSKSRYRFREWRSQKSAKRSIRISQNMFESSILISMLVTSGYLFTREKSDGGLASVTPDASFPTTQSIGRVRTEAEQAFLYAGREEHDDETDDAAQSRQDLETASQAESSRQSAFLG